MNAPVPAPPRRLGQRRLALLALTVLPVLLLLAFSTWLLTTTSGLRMVARAVEQLTDGVVRIEGASGALQGGFTLARLTVTTPSTTVVAEELRAKWIGFDLQPLRFEFDTLDAQRLAVRVRPPPQPSTAPPPSIASPVAVAARQLNVALFELETGPQASTTRLEARAVQGHVELDASGYVVHEGSFSFGPRDAPLRAALSGDLRGARPFALNAKATVEATVSAQAVQADLTAGGSLESIDVQATLAGAGGRGTVRAQVASFAPPALRQLQVAVSGVDPAVWVAGAPQADLALDVQLEPLAGSPLFTLRGPVRATNGAAGTVDRKRLPVQSARGEITLSAESLSVKDLNAVIGTGRVQGSLSWSLQQRERWQADVTLAALDPARLHSAARPLLLDGNLRAVTVAAGTRVQGSLRNRGTPAVAADLDLTVDATRLVLSRGDLRLAGGSAQVSGEVQFTGSRALAVLGTINRLDPSVLWPALPGQLTGAVAVNARLAPQPEGSARFDLADSTLLGRPLAARGDVQLNADQSLQADVQASVRTARVTARGGLGAPDQTLRIEASVPDLAVLLPQTAGTLDLVATLRGDWRAPAVDAQLRGARLRGGGHALGQLKAVATYSGGNDGQINLQASGSDHKHRANPIVSLRAIGLAVDGSLSAHALQLTATNEETQPVRLVARGGWQREATGPRWRGEFTEALAGKPLDLRLAAPAQVSTNFADFSLQTPALELFGAQVSELRLKIDARGLDTVGRLDGLRPGDLLGRGFERQPLAVGQSASRTPLTLRGQWQLRLADQADGQITLERASGDIYTSASGASSAIGLDTLRLALQLRANRLTGEAQLAGTRAGRIAASLATEVERSPDGWRLAQTRPLAAQLDADVPSIEWINGILSERIRANVRLAGSLQARIGVTGTPAEPRADGRITGDELRVAWIEQGVRLEGGTLRARLDGSAVILDELRFTGPPRVSPADKRAALAAGNQPGVVTMNGQLGLRDFNGVLQVAADRLPLLQRPDRWVVASGGANIVFTERSVQANGAVVAAAGFVDFSRPDLPVLSSDVNVVRPGDEVRERTRDPGLAVSFDLGVGLGDHFYLRGLGLDTRIDGAVRIRGDARGNVRATGAVESKEGTYQGYGQRLAIERGRVNFQGPLDNPGLDVLALRKGLPVEAGLSITGTAAEPIVRLYSDPPMADFETLSWLALGRPAEQGGGDNVALARAAAGILGGTGEGLPMQLARTLGLDDVSIRSGDLSSPNSLLPRQTVAGTTRGDGTVPTTVGNEIISVGKRLNDTLTLTYEQAVSGAANAVQLSYQISRRLSLVARAGTDNAIDLVYSFAFD